VATYIAGQEMHHRKKTFGEEFDLFVKKYGLEWRTPFVALIHLAKARC